MSNKKSNTKPSASKSSGSKNSSSKKPTNPLAALLGALILVIAAIVYVITGVDLTGGQLSATTPPPAATVTAAPTVTATRLPVLRTPAPTVPPATVPPATAAPSGAVETISLPNGFGTRKGFWEVYFVNPIRSTDTSLFVDGISVPLVQAIGRTRRTLDIAAFEMNEPTVTQAILDAHRRGVRVRMVTDNEHGTGASGTTITQLIEAGIPVVDDNRGGLMHNKFMIMDGQTVWMGATNFTRNGMYRNNNNMVMLRSPQAVAFYQAEFDEMFVDKRFGTTSPRGNSGSFVQDGTPVQVWFASEDDVVTPIVNAIRSARRNVRFMAFSFTQEEIGAAVKEAAARGVKVEGVFERTGSETAASEMPKMFCAGLAVRQDGNPSTMHHKVFIIDDQTVITGSFNFSANAVRTNDENLLIMTDRDFARAFNEEFDRVWAQGRTPTIACP
ncbi:MAG: phospholipase D-like domain-containing protein [Anaerolineae bacterium]|nr:phospholipase D-like domain-containing protein [Anaerolineae bacterium]MDW8171822.1 phospholipase D-like domain-containing protein [Anaerolineae bacterium]